MAAGLPRFLGCVAVEIGVFRGGSIGEALRFLVKLYCGSPIEERLGRPVGEASGISVAPLTRTLLEGVDELLAAPTFRFLVGGMVDEGTL